MEGNDIERIEMRDNEQRAKDLTSPAGRELLRQFYGHYLERPQNMFFCRSRSRSRLPRR